MALTGARAQAPGLPPGALRAVIGKVLLIRPVRASGVAGKWSLADSGRAAYMNINSGASGSKPEAHRQV